MDKKEFIDQVKILIQVGDMPFLESLMAKQKFTSPAHYQKLVSTLETKHDFNIPHQLCKSGDLSALTFFKSKVPSLSLNFTDASG